MDVKLRTKGPTMKLSSSQEVKAVIEVACEPFQLVNGCYSINSRTPHRSLALPGVASSLSFHPG